VPESGDFRINCEARIKADLQEQYEKMFGNKLAEAMRDPWDRLHKVLTHMTDKLTDDEDGDRKIFRDSIIDNAVELCDLLTRLNVVKDPELEKARRMLEQAVTSTDIKDLRALSSARLELKTDVQSILNKFQW
jgi:hypothetical protein